MSATHKRGDLVPGMPGFRYINPRWPAGKEPCVERVDASCDGDSDPKAHQWAKAAAYPDHTR